VPGEPGLAHQSAAVGVGEAAAVQGAQLEMVACGQRMRRRVEPVVLFRLVGWLVVCLFVCLFVDVYFV